MEHTAHQPDVQTESQKPPLVILTGPTAVGKTSLSIRLAQRIGGEIISADSMQVYKDMDIGSAKIRPEEMDGVVHHLVDVIEPTEPFDVTRFQTMALEAMKKIRERGHIPILVGGTGFYIQAILYDIDFNDQAQDDSLRRRLEQEALSLGARAMHERLEKIDPESAEAIPEGNVKRVIRALEYYELTGEKISEHNKEQKAKQSPYNFACFVLTDERAKLYAAIDRRVDLMIEEGLVEEVKGLIEKGVRRTDTAMQGLGYREIYDYLAGDTDLPEAVRLIKRNTRHFAKRQLTWFRPRPETIWLEKSEFHYDQDAILERMLEILSRQGIIPGKG
ncbi:MAG: tRNA (adenosine(37)-N6)-dimethylallyltransferase MiaA [Lachnospiraceae bacterium]|nr:tRNA (adenosine(37)-N6)-dimethylallyltransferase MiaA [Lachnospiraceae bacterium]